MLPRIRPAVTLAAITLLAIPDQTAAQADASGPRLEIRNARLAAEPGFRHIAFAYPEYLPASLKDSPNLSGIYVALEPMLSDADFGDVSSISIDRRGLHLIVTLTPEGAARMEQKATLGHHVAILADGALADAAPLAGFFSDEVPLFMTVRVPEPIAENLAAYLKARWPGARHTRAGRPGGPPAR